MEKQYESLGISKEVYAFGKKIEDSLKERFAAIDATVEYNQMKVIHAMQKNKVSAECFNISTTDTDTTILEGIPWSRSTRTAFHGEDALVRPQITCGTHALALALMSQSASGR